MPKTVLRQNLKALMDKNAESQTALGRRAKVGQATVGRILSSKGEDSGVETVAKLAKAYGLEAWQLLVAGMDPSNPPVLQPVSKEERALYDRLRALMNDMGKMK